MVVAEIPLWVVHSHASSTTDASLPASPGVAPGSSGQPRSQEQEAPSLEDARRWLGLWQPGAARKKCPIYGVDVHPTRGVWATAGGDGKVRLWLTQALFQDHVQGGHFDESGAYVSTGSSAEEEEEEEDNDQHEKEDNHQGDNSHSSKKEAGASDLPVDDDNPSKQQQEEVEEEAAPVHDLTNVVRRKKPSNLGLESGAPPPPLVVRTAPSTHHPHGTSSSSLHTASTAHRLVCTLSAHSGSSVLAVRFSVTGDYLASAGDDGVVCIYAPAAMSADAITAMVPHSAHPGPEDSVSTKLATSNHPHHHQQHHQWSRIHVCRGHGLDVVDLAWAPDDSHLVSCSLDSETPIIVWKLTDAHSSRRDTLLLHPFKVLGKGIHTSTVKGVAFDPAGSYLASSGDDPAVCIWRAHDDWGLEKRIEASAGIFRQWKDGDPTEGSSLSSQSLFRRISWSTDGAYVCSTNSVVKNKHVASTISREGWSVSNSEVAASGAANLVGHKQPVVVSRHCSTLLHAKKKKKSGDRKGGPYDEEEDEEPDYATLLALGDRRGFVSVWSTRKSRPVFKLQCSEARSTVTDLAWGTLKNGDLLLLVSLLDGQVVALRFAVPAELGHSLSKKEQGRVFQLRYGIDMDETDMHGTRRLLVGQHSGPQLIENAMQMSLEENVVDDDPSVREDETPAPSAMPAPPQSIRERQEESRAQGKKRVRPVLVSAGPSEKRPKVSNLPKKSKEKQPSSDPLEQAMNVAKRASAAVKGLNSGAGEAPAKTPVNEAPAPTPATTSQTRLHQRGSHVAKQVVHTVSIPHPTDRLYRVDLPTQARTGVDDIQVTAECANAVRVPTGSKGASVQCVDLVIKRGGQVTWMDQIPGTSCSALATSRTILAVGTTDGCIQLYGASPTLGWTCSSAFRSHPPLVLGSAVISLHLSETTKDGKHSLQMVAAASDGFFGVYSVVPELRVLYKGSLLPPMTHMSISSSMEEGRLPNLSRLFVTENGKILLLLSLPQATIRQVSGERQPVGGAGGSVQAFVFDPKSELWFRVSDSRFIVSDFYSALPAGRTVKGGLLQQADDSVRLGAAQSSLKASHRACAQEGSALELYIQGSEDVGSNLVTRSHCEDRMACALALESSPEFQFWLSQYAKALSMGGQATSLRLLVDLLLGEVARTPEGHDSVESSCWWLSHAPRLLKMDRQNLVRSVVLPAMSRNRSLQRLTSEVSVELNIL